MARNGVSIERANRCELLTRRSCPVTVTHVIWRSALTFFLFLLYWRLPNVKQMMKLINLIWLHLNYSYLLPSLCYSGVKIKILTFYNKSKTPEFLLHKRKLGFLADIWPSISLCLSRARRRTASAKRSFFFFQNYQPPAPLACSRCPLTCIRDQSLHLLSQINSHCSIIPKPAILHSHPKPCIHNSLPCTQQRTSCTR